MGIVNESFDQSTCVFPIYKRLTKGHCGQRGRGGGSAPWGGYGRTHPPPPTPGAAARGFIEPYADGRIGFDRRLSRHRL